MKLSLLILFLATTASAADFAAFTRAIHSVETSGRLGPTVGDGGRALGPLQIHRGCWQDSKVGGSYEDVADLAVSTAVLRAYLHRYAPRALSAEDWFTCARVWNGGPKGASRFATVGYARAVVGRL